VVAHRFELHRDTDVSGVSGTGVVAEGVEFSSGVVALTWLSEWPTSVVFHDRGIESVQAVHGHDGKTRIVWLDFDVDENDEATDISLREAVTAKQATTCRSCGCASHRCRTRDGSGGCPACGCPWGPLALPAREA
jgi:hypothetical protein